MMFLRRLLLATLSVAALLTTGCGGRSASSLCATMQSTYAAANSLQWHGEVTIHRSPAEGNAGPLSMVSEVALERPGKMVIASRLVAAGQTGLASEMTSDGTTAWLSLSRGDQPIVFRAPAPPTPMELLADEMVQVPELFERSPIISPLTLFYGAVDLADAELTLADEPQTIDGAECVGVSVQEGETRAAQRLWIGREDHLLHGVDFTVQSEGEQQRVDVSWRAAQLVKDVASPANAFAFQAPEGVEVREGATFTKAYDILRFGIGEPAKDFKLKSVDGKQTLTLAELKGKPVVLDFWATWCGPCEAAQPSLQKLHEEYGDRVNVIMITDEDAATAAPVIAQRGLTMPQYLDADHKVMAQFGVNAFPTTIYIDAEGVVRAGTTGVDPNGDIYAQLMEPLQPLLGK